MSHDKQSLPKPSESGPNRYYLIFGVMIFCFMILGARLWHLQLIQGEELRGKSERNRRATDELRPARGVITDRFGLVLADNQAHFNLCVQKAEIPDPEKLIAELSVLTDQPYGELWAKYQALPRRSQRPQTLISNLSRQQVVAVESRRFRLEGVSLEVSVLRRPLSGVLASHVVGYLSEISQAQLSRERKILAEAKKNLEEDSENHEELNRILQTEYRPHRAGDLVGQAGVEQSMEYYLQGLRGLALREINSRGHTIRRDQLIEPQMGGNIRLTIDSRLQAIAQQQLDNKAGAIVMMDPNNFEILALASSPTFSVTDFIGGISVERWRSLADDPFKPMFNRAVAGQYPPGSTYKIVVALAALAEGLFSPDETIFCPGTFRLADRDFGCHNRMGHGAINLRQALKYSCDVYFYELGRRLGGDRMAALARDFFGLGHKMGLDIPGEEAGVIPDSAWLKERYKQSWRPGDTINASIGQGYVLCTPLQVAQFTSVLANGGKLYRPRLLKDIVDASGNMVKSFEPQLISELRLDPKAIEAVRGGLTAVVNEYGGTGYRAWLPEVTVAGKTGTSQVVAMSRYQGYRQDEIPYEKRDHAWFSGYAPAAAPEVVVTVLLEHAGGGGVFAAPIARHMLAAYFDKSLQAEVLPPPQQRPDQGSEED